MTANFMSLHFLNITLMSLGVEHNLEIVELVLMYTAEYNFDAVRR